MSEVPYPFIGQIRLVAFSWAPKDYALCDGATMEIDQHQALYSLITTQFGGDGKVSFCLPDLRGRTPMHPDHFIKQGDSAGWETVTLTQKTMPRHTHTFKADRSPGDCFAAEDFGDPTVHYVLAQPEAIAAQTSQILYAPPSNLTSLAPETSSMVGGGLAHNNLQPSLVVTYVISLEGLYPSRN